MKKANILCINTLLLTLIFASCNDSKRYTVGEITVSRVLMDSSLDLPAATPMSALVDSFKTLMNSKTNEIIGAAARDMVKGKPQSLLGNFTADAMLNFGRRTWGAADFAITNVGGIRTTMNSGPVTVGNLYEIYPFENEVVLLELKGAAVEKLFRALAPKGGEAISTNIECVINGKNLESLKIGGRPVDPAKTYRIVTINYLAEGNDGMAALTEATSEQQSGVLIRDMIIEHIKLLTAEGKKIDAKLDNRVKIK